MGCITHGPRWPARTGKPVVTRASLETDVFTTAKDRLRLKIIELRTPKKPKAQTGTFADGRAKFDQATETRRDLAEALREIDLFVDELKTNWLQDYQPWALELQGLLREFCDTTEAGQLLTLRERLRDCLSRRELKGIDYLLGWADDVITSELPPPSSQ